MRKSFWILAAAALGLSACMPAAAPPPPAVDVMGAPMEAAPEPVPIICDASGSCAPA